MLYKFALPALLLCATSVGAAARDDLLDMSLLQAESGEALAQQFGRYDSPNGSVFSFGIQRMVAIDGAMVALQRIDIPDIGKLMMDATAGTRSAAVPVTTLQVGVEALPAGVVLGSGELPAVIAGIDTGATRVLLDAILPQQIVQNTADARVIQISTQIDIAAPLLTALQGSQALEQVSNSILQTLQR
ncbi:hypothetical protein [Craterilacuibacter sinensis]|uniref:Uncharacterized protein n=1 Tax=Craterilacuibacter sinensis TaxID=2686017 RepID=A0A845BIL5_9NEIS|nr:hypothetical protein [Craterilacuibacter sinensis]MXR36012.1 hypothetical protein [Craterilacuibacter sinensis]